MTASELDRLQGYELGAIDYVAVPIVPESSTARLPCWSTSTKRSAISLATKAPSCITERRQAVHLARLLDEVLDVRAKGIV